MIPGDIIKTMKIYFAGSIRGGRDDQENYFFIINELRNFGQVLTEYIGKKEIHEMDEDNLTDNDIFERDVKWIKESDVIVAEVTNPSLGVGFELGFAESLNKKIICLFRENSEKRLSAMINGNKYMKVFKYSSLTEINDILTKNLK